MRFSSYKLSKQKAPEVSLGNVQAASVGLGSATTRNSARQLPRVTKWGFLSVHKVSFLISPALRGEEISQRGVQMETELNAASRQFPDR